MKLFVMEPKTCIGPAIPTSCQVSSDPPHIVYSERESAVKSDFPTGYGGNIPCMRHEVIHRNTSFEKVFGHHRDSQVATSDYQQPRFKFPDFAGVKQGTPIFTRNPRVPSKGDLCIVTGGHMTGEDLIAAHKNGPFAIQPMTTPLLKYDTEAARPADH